jgi:hypothetical protein
MGSPVKRQSEDCRPVANRRASETQPRARRPAAAAPPAGAGSAAPYRFALLVAFACLLVSVSFRLYEYDMWEHLTYGRAVWQLHRVPRTQIWTWPDFDTPQVNPSWGFSALVWPFWAAGDDLGLAMWRWLTTLVAFALLWGAARAMGVRGPPALVALVICGLVYRQRSQVRPETLAAVLLALTLWLLATRRGPGRRDAWLVVAVWAWANVHISWPLGMGLIAMHALAARVPPGRPALRGLGLVVVAAAAAAFVNPFGPRAVWRPFEYLFVWRHDPLLSGISELKPLDWSVNLFNGLPLLLVGWPALALWRSRRRGPDALEWGVCVLGTVLALGGNRFVATYALLAAPWCARDLDDWWHTRRWARATAHSWREALATSALCVTLPLWEWTHYENRLGIHPDDRREPVAACDFMMSHGVRGRGFNDFFLGGYLLWRFWPDRGRLPYFDIHPEDKTAEERLGYLRAFTSTSGWIALSRRRGFDWAILSRLRMRDPGLLDALDSDPDWCLVFADDAAALFVRRDGALGALADTSAYHVLPGGGRRTRVLVEDLVRDPALAALLAPELERQQRESNRTLASEPLRQLCKEAAAAASH